MDFCEETYNEEMSWRRVFTHLLPMLKQGVKAYLWTQELVESGGRDAA